MMRVRLEGESLAFASAAVGLRPKMLRSRHTDPAQAKQAQVPSKPVSSGSEQDGADDPMIQSNPAHWTISGQWWQANDV